MELTKQQLIQWLEKCAETFSEQQNFLTELDTAIGDADHGLNMHRGFSKVIEKLPTVADKDIGAILKTVGMTLLSSVGGASGPLFGTFFMKMAPTTNGKESLTLAEFTQALNDGITGIVSRGKAELGDKTMCDVWLPVLDSIKQSSDFPNALESAVSVAETALAGTIPMQAKKGRASYLGERSVGHQDPGATSATFMIKALHQVVVNG
ncbi:dihydroxyacetone kinase subunit DhaL [Otariodibacter sp.]|uniref:dihydroxyacetone kinase subunit DhaL n=1 Tax=Otariodibacter sp. TaxID=3030919 RepID=UPI00261CBCE0|nr:dihydroxyacetone kinase subunit DhaL [Otariodibacter sp.]